MCVWVSVMAVLYYIINPYWRRAIETAGWLVGWLAGILECVVVIVVVAEEDFQGIK